MPIPVLDYRWKVPSVSSTLNLWFLTDQHLGARDCAVGRIKEVIEKVAADPVHNRAVLGGDCCDFVNFTDPRFDIRSIAYDFIPDLDNLAQSTSDYFIKLHRPIRDQIVALFPGNHDEKIRLRYHQDPAAYIAMVMGIPLLSQVSMVRIFVEDDAANTYTVKGVFSHAERGGSTSPSKLRALESMVANYDGIDFFAQAHTHEYLFKRLIRNRVAGDEGQGYLKERPIMIFLTGGYLKTYGEGYSGYGAKKGYAPCELGSPRLKMTMHRNAVTHEDGRKSNRLELSGE